MAKVLRQAPVKVKEAHPYSRFLDGRIWKLSRRRDFRTKKIESVRTALHRLAVQAGSVARISQPDDNTLIVQMKRPQIVRVKRLPQYDW